MFLISSDNWEIKHVPPKGRGVFVTIDINAGTVIGDYIGRVVKTAEEDTLETDEGLYLMYYHDYASIYPEDVNAPGIHLLNHSCTPNAWMYTYRGHTLFFALRHIFKGEELTISYLLSPQEDCGEDCTHICHCGSNLCKNTMHLSREQFKKWNEFNLKQMTQTKRERIRYGELLPKLDAYPNEISDIPIYDLFGSFTKPALECKDSKIPSIKDLRKTIRESGQTITFPKLSLRVLGIQANKIISENMT